MHILMCGFLGPPHRIATVPEVITAMRGTGRTEGQCKLVGGGWGCVGAITEGVLQLQCGYSNVSSSLFQSPPWCKPSCFHILVTLLEKVVSDLPHGP